MISQEIVTSEEANQKEAEEAAAAASTRIWSIMKHIEKNIIEKCIFLNIKNLHF